jgi:hypothetical protein
MIKNISRFNQLFFCIIRFTALFFPIMDSFSQTAGEEDRNIIIRNCIQTFTYTVQNNKFVVKEMLETNYVCDQFKASADISIFYDNNLILDNLKIKSKGGHSRPLHRPYFREHIENTDDKICYFQLYFAKRNETASVKVEKTHTDLHYFNKVYFTEPFFTQQKTIRFIVPRWMKMEILLKNPDKHIEQQVDYDAKQDADIYTFTINESKAWKNEEFAPGIAHIYPHLLIINRSAEHKGIREIFFNTLQDLYTWNRQFVLNVRNDLDSIRIFTGQLIAKVSSEDEKIRTIYEWVQENIRYLSDNYEVAGYQPKPAQEVLRNKYGDCKGMANLLKCMLTSIGFDARLAWTGTNDIACNFSDVPTIASANHMICVLFLPDGKHYLDATLKYMTFGCYSEITQGRQILIEDGDNYLLDVIPVRSPEQNTETETADYKIEGQSLTGTVSHLFKGESKNRFLYAVNSIKKDDINIALTDYSSKQNSQYTLSGLQSDLQSRNETVRFSYHVDNKYGINLYDNKYYISPDFRNDLSSLTIDTAKRTSDYWLPHKYHIVHQCKIEIPAGLEIAYLPEDFLLERDGYSFRIRYTHSGNQLYYNKELIIRNPEITKNIFTQWNLDIEKLKSCYQEQTVLTIK